MRLHVHKNLGKPSVGLGGVRIGAARSGEVR
jgi:hypothetical protein